MKYDSRKILGALDYILNESQNNPDDSLVDIANEAFKLNKLDGLSAEYDDDNHCIVLRQNIL